MKYQKKIIHWHLLLACILIAFASATAADINAPGFIDDNEYLAESESERQQSYIEINREGVVEKLPVVTVHLINFSTTIATEPEYFVHSLHEGVDTFTYDAWKGESEVYYSVSRIAQSGPNQICEDLFHRYGEKYAFSHVSAVKVGCYDATAVQFDGEKDHSSYQRHFFIIPTDGDCIVIEAQFDFEMYEGLYQIMLALFDTLKIG